MQLQGVPALRASRVEVHLSADESVSTSADAGGLEPREEQLAYRDPDGALL
jgi:hypothetical protein